MQFGSVNPYARIIGSNHVMLLVMQFGSVNLYAGIIGSNHVILLVMQFGNVNLYARIIGSNRVILLVMQFGNVNLYVRIVHHRDAERHLSVSYSPTELNRYQAVFTAAVTFINYYQLSGDVQDMHEKLNICALCTCRSSSWTVL